LNDVSDLHSVLLRATCRKLQNRMRRIRAGDESPGADSLPQTNDALLAVDEHHVDRTSHETGVNRAATRQEQRDTGEITLPHEPEKPPAERERDLDFGEDVASDYMPPFP